MAIGPAREVRYLNALRGPTGQGLHFKRRGSGPGSNGTILDIYDITYAGIEKPLVLYVDEEHWTPDPKAPRGLICGSVIGLTPPGPDPFETMNQQRLIGLEMGAASAPLDPIPIDPDRTIARGVVFDYVRVLAAAARAAAAAGHPIDPKALPRELTSPHIVVVAIPIVCDGRRVTPESVTIADANGNAPRRLEEARSDGIARLIPGYDAPASAIAAAYATPQLVGNARTTIRYDGPDCAGNREVVIPVSFTPARLVSAVVADAPTGVEVPTGTQVVVQVFIGFDQKPLLPAYVRGPVELLEPALATAVQWRIAPPTINGVPVLATQSIAITFKQP